MVSIYLPEKQVMFLCLCCLKIGHMGHGRAIRGRWDTLGLGIPESWVLRSYMRGPSCRGVLAGLPHTTGLGFQTGHPLEGPICRMCVLNVFARLEIASPHRGTWCDLGVCPKADSPRPDVPTIPTLAAEKAGQTWVEHERRVHMLSKPTHCS